MSRVVTFGRQPTEAPPGNFKEVIFPELAKLDQGTNEGWISRILSSDGADTRELPRTISFQELDTVGHDMAAHVGSIWEVTVDGETGVLSGKGWLADDEMGHKAAFAIASKKLRHNSIDLAEVTKVEYEEHGDYWDDDFKLDIIFKEWKFGKTTLVALPAFANAYAEVADDLAAAIGDAPLVCDAPWCFESNAPATQALELAASIQAKPKFEYFHRPESDDFTAVTVGEPDENGWIPVWGHFSDWKKEHRDAGGRLRHPPRGKDGYATYCASKVLTDAGYVFVGPVTLLGGHVTLQQAAEDIANTWADVRVIDGKLGHWMCGVVRPNVSQDQAQVYVARASQVSGYWPDGETLRLICSVSAAGFPVLEAAKDGEFALAASLSVGPGPMPAALKSFKEMSDEDQRTVKQWVAEALAAGSGAPTEFQLDITGANEDITTEFDEDAAAAKRESMLAALAHLE